MSQIKRKGIEDNAVDGAKTQLQNNQTLRGRNFANTADVDIVKITTADKIEFQNLPEVNTGLSAPTNTNQLATVGYVNAYASGIRDVKDSVRLLADSQTATSGSTPLVIDGVTTVNGDRIALVGQTAGAQNGIYDVTITGGTYSLSRSSDADVSAEVTQGLFFKIVEGTVYSGFEALLQTSNITLGTTALVFVTQPSVASQTAGDMLIKSGNNWSIDLASNGGLESTNPGNQAGQLRVKTDTAAAEKDQSTRRDPTSGFIDAKTPVKETFTLSATNITNQYIDLANVAHQGSIVFTVVGGGPQFETTDYTVNYTGGASSKTRITFAGGLATAGVSALVASDIVHVTYSAF